MEKQSRIQELANDINALRKCCNILWKNRRMYNEFEHEDDNWRPEKSKFRKIAVKIFSVGFVAFVFAVIAFMCVRLALSKPPKNMKELIWTEEAFAQYSAAPNEFDIIYYPSTDSFSEDSMYSISNIYYTKSLGQFQATVRYNERALRYLAESKEVDELAEGEIFVFKLRDNFGKVYTEYKYTSDTKSGYGYRRVIFDGVDMNDVATLHLEVYYIGDVGGEESVVATLNMYRYDYAPQTVFIDPPQKSTEGLLPRPSYTEKLPISEE